MLKIHPVHAGIAVGVAFACLAVPQALAQGAGVIASDQNLSRTDKPVRPSTDNFTESGIQPDAIRMYDRAVRELHQGHAVPAEQDANRALRIDPKFADAAALAATAALMQQQFIRATVEASQAIQINPADEKAYVILATGQNYLGHYSAAAEALGHVRPQEQSTWQVAYQWARAEAGLQNLQQCLEWTNRAALSAPPEFAPLHLLRTSVMVTLGENARAADELQIYLQLPSVNPSQRELFTQELHRLRQLPPIAADSQSLPAAMQ
ncbi:MAG: hypothetical protein ACRD28_05425 [Acidobacteriaceae bacterium]